jgi:CubicO group peptidase (beta-lactamase class C family)
MSGYPCVRDTPGSGFGLGVSVRVELGLAERVDSIGAFGWNGLASTFLRVDPSERLVRWPWPNTCPSMSTGFLAAWPT